MGRKTVMLLLVGLLTVSAVPWSAAASCTTQEWLATPGACGGGAVNALAGVKQTREEVLPAAHLVANLPSVYLGLTSGCRNKVTGESLCPWHPPPPSSAAGGGGVECDGNTGYCKVHCTGYYKLAVAYVDHYEGVWEGEIEGECDYAIDQVWGRLKVHQSYWLVDYFQDSGPRRSFARANGSCEPDCQGNWEAQADWLFTLPEEGWWDPPPEGGPCAYVNYRTLECHRSSWLAINPNHN
ncbi:MAG: hypothetical protein ACREV8_00405 [Gammaproteobacteria bacterium]